MATPERMDGRRIDGRNAVNVSERIAGLFARQISFKSREGQLVRVRINLIPRLMRVDSVTEEFHSIDDRKSRKPKRKSFYLSDATHIAHVEVSERGSKNVVSAMLRNH